MANISRWDPFEDGFFNIFPAVMGSAARRQADRQMPVDVVETDNTYEMSMELPGVAKDGIQVSIYDNRVSISAESREERDAGDKSSWLLRERSFGKFARTLTLPEAVDENAANARHVDGVLYLTLPKKAANNVKRLTIH
jgi:HSP20 family protein